ncbi:hypothetical protein JVX98_26390 [Ensifer sp. PDNC004]|nr:MULTISPECIES: hypothetical protein [unclassified Ensifer]MBD9648294.1 hypothetical protein [Ensifer sp. ENS09]QRY67836.1 hypothetical protein JVX98_26390 [Ensifer sp. PDNC004]
MNASRPMIQSRYALYASAPARRSFVHLVPHAIAIAAAFSFVSAVVVGAF